MPKTKLCIIADSIDTQYAGIFTYTSQLIPALEASKPHDMEITYLHQRHNSFFDGRKELIVQSHRRYPGADTVRRMIHIPELLRREGFDLVHDLGHIAPFPRKKEQYAKILTVHDLTPILMPQMHVHTSRIMHKYVFPRIIAHTDHIITVSETTKGDLTRLLNPACPVTAIPLAAKPLDYCQPEPIDTPYILCVSTLEPRKNITVLLEAFEQLKDAGFPHKLVLVGKKGWQVDELLMRLAHSPWLKHIIRPGFVSDAELAGWYAYADLVVYPSQYEGFGLPMLEAMHARRPLLVHDTPAAREVAAGGACILSMNKETLSTAMQKYLSHRDLRESLAREGYDRAASFTWKKTAEATWSTYRQVLSA